MRSRLVTCGLLLGTLTACEAMARATWLLPPSPAVSRSDVERAFALGDAVATEKGLRYSTLADTTEYYVWTGNAVLTLRHDAWTRIEFEVSQIGNAKFRPTGLELVAALESALETEYRLSCAEEWRKVVLGDHEEVHVCRVR